MFAVEKILFCTLDFIGCHVLDIRSGNIYFQGQYCSLFLVIFFALIVFVFNAFLVIIFLQPLLGV